MKKTMSEVQREHILQWLGAVLQSGNAMMVPLW